MASLETVEFPINDLVPKFVINVKVTGTRVFWLRKRLGLWFLKWGAYIASFVGKLDIHIKT